MTELKVDKVGQIEKKVELSSRFFLSFDFCDSEADDNELTRE